MDSFESNFTMVNKSKPYKIVLVGDGGTGKSSYVSRLNQDKFEKEYIATLGVEKYTIAVETSEGYVLVDLWDTAGQERLGPMRDGYYVGADAAILFFDVTSRITYKSVPGWYQDIVRVSKDIPVVLCANKVDVKERKVKSKSITFPNKHDVGFYEISVKDRTLLKEPIEYILCKLLGKTNLKIKSSLDATLAFDDMFEDATDSLHITNINDSDSSDSSESEKEFEDAPDSPDHQNDVPEDDLEYQDANTSFTDDAAFVDATESFLTNELTRERLH